MPEKRKNLSPEELRSMIQDHIEQQQAEYERQADKLYERVMGRLHKGKYRITSEGVITFTLWLWSAHDTRAVELLSARLETAGYHVRRPSLGGGWGDALEFEITIVDKNDSNHRPKPSIAALMGSDKR